ncbi:uncharacterized protein LOC127714024 [Mytilus californianus]|uniref:uncharacterized protein LOC127714024 n=1 Tax=Mytilus californianus TaxID=6549 RepID=UPI002247B81C|nr:uncharacterized protein LOC127714024 [Mytilus californianus]
MLNHPTKHLKVQPLRKKTDETKRRIGTILPRSFLEGKPEAREVLEKKKRRENEKTQEHRVKRFPNPSFIFEKKPHFKEVFYINIPDTERGKELLLHDLPIQWTMPEPEAVICITGIDHQFNIKDNYKLKRDLIKAVISTESWIVTCCNESGVVQFIEEAVNAHVAMENCHISIVGILPQRVYDGMQEVHVRAHDEIETRKILPVVLVLIEGGIHALRTAWSVLKNENHVVVIDGSGGAADFLAACCDRASRKSKGEIPDKTLKEIIEEHFDDDSDILLREIINCQNGIHVVSLEKNTNGVDEIIQDTMFEINNEYHKWKLDKEKGMKNKSGLKTNAVKEQLRLVAKWQRCDIAEKKIFIAKNRIQLTCLQKLDKKRMDELQFEIRKEIKYVKKKYTELHSRYFPEYYKKFQESTKQFEEDTSQFKEVTKAHYFSVLSTSFDEIVEHMPLYYFKDPKKTELKLKKITKELELVDKTRNKKGIAELGKQIGRVLEQVKEDYRFLPKKLSASYNGFKKAMLQFKDVDDNKAKYFSDLSQSFEVIMDHMTVDALNGNKHKLREIVKKIVDEYKKDMVSQLLLTSIISNRNDLVELTIGRIENIEAFVFDKIANIYSRCVKENKEDLPIKLIVQKLENRYEKTEDTKQIKREDNEYLIEIEIESQEQKRNRQKSNEILFVVDDFIKDLLGETKFQLYTHFTKPKPKPENDKDKDGNSEKPVINPHDPEAKKEAINEISIEYKDKPFFHLFVMAVLANWKEMAISFWKRDTDHTCKMFCSLIDKRLFKDLIY